MTIPVPLDGLRAAVAERGAAAYLLAVGRRSAANAAARPAVSLLFAVRADGDYSLIVDGTAAVVPGGEGRTVLVTPSHAVLHRAAAVPDPTAACGADCLPIR